MGIGGAFFHAGIHDSKRLLDGPELRCTVGFFRPDKPYRVHFKDETPMSKDHQSTLQNQPRPGSTHRAGFERTSVKPLLEVSPQTMNSPGDGGGLDGLGGGRLL